VEPTALSKAATKSLLNAVNLKSIARNSSFLAV